MAKTQTDFYTKITRSMLSSVKEIGAMPFILFEYYLTWETASDGIRPSLQTVAEDLGLEKNAVCNLRSKLIKAGWIRYENEQVFILKSFTKNESKPKNHSQKMNNHSQKMNEPFTKNEQSFTKNESLYKEENKQRINNKKEQRINIGETSSPKEKISRSKSDLTLEQKQAFNACMDFLKNSIGDIPDYGAQGKALKWMLTKGASQQQIEQCLTNQIVEYGGRYRASFLTVQKVIFNPNLQNGANNGQIQQPNSNGHRVSERDKRGNTVVNFRKKIAELRNVSKTETNEANGKLLGNGNGFGVEVG